MGRFARWACGVAGGLCVAFGLGILSLMFFATATGGFVSLPPADAGERIARLSFGGYLLLALFALIWVFIGSLLGVKVVFGPSPTFLGAVRHLLWALGAAAALAFVPFAVIVLSPAFDRPTPDTGPRQTP